MSIGAYGNDNRISSSTYEALHGKIDEIRISNTCRYSTNQTVAAPVLIPYTPDPTTDRTPTLQWQAVSGATNYKILIDDNSNFSSPLVNTNTGNVTSFTPSADLPLVRIYWKVSSSLDYNAYSSVDDFLVYQPVTAPVLIPYTPDPTYDQTPTLQWQAVSGAGNYLIQVDDNSNFGSPLVSSIVSGATNFTPSSNFPFGTVYWKIASDLDYGVFSSVDDFTILEPVSPPDIIPYIPDPTVDRTPTLAWQAVSGAGNYRIQIDDNSDFGSPLVTTTVSGATDYTAPSDLPLGNIFWRVSSSLDYNIYSNIDTFLIASPVPELVLLDGRQVCDNTPALVWHAVTGASNYLIQLAKDMTFSGPSLINSSMVTDTSYISSSNLDDGIYFWRVSSSHEYVTFSGADSFVVISACLDAPSITLPEEKSEVDDTAMLAWTPVTGCGDTAVQYELQISLDSLFVDTLLLQDSVVSSQIRIADLDSLNSLPMFTRLYWRVIAWDDSGYYSDHSSVRSFYLKSKTVGIRFCYRRLLRNSLTAFPNPFNPVVRLEYGFKKDGMVRLNIYNVNGVLIKRIENGERKAGWYGFTWDGRDEMRKPLPTGFYICRFRAGDFRKTIRLLMIK
jgi:hypothetical protein